jgi:cytochrome P450
MANNWSGQVLPHPSGRQPVIGDFRTVMRGDRRSPLQNMLRIGAGLGPLFEVQVFRQKFAVVTGAALTAELCDERRFQKALAPGVEALRDFAGDGLFTAHSDEPNWSLAHDLLRPAFTREAMQRYHPVMLEATRELFAVWDSRTEPVDVAADMTKLTMETISRSAFSHDFGSFTAAEPHPFVPAMVASLRNGQRKGNLGPVPGSRLLIRRLDRRVAAHQAYVDTLLDDLIAERRAPGAEEHEDLLGIMLNTAHPDTGERIGDLNIRHQILTFLVAGHETTSGALSFALYYLCQDPALLARAQAETDAILGDDPDAEPTFEQVPKLRLLRRVLDEGLRLWPTAPGFARTPLERTVLSTGHVMEPGDWAVVMLPAVHRDPEAWGDDAESFDPDRFLPERARGRAPHSYKPFGTGERACIGRQFALHEAVLVLARILHRFDLEPDPAYELRITERLTLMPEGFRVRLTRRTPAAGGAVPGAGADPVAEGCPVAH